jgi:uncharacterized membrane protein
MGLNSGLYKILLLLHILSVVVGLGAVTLNGLYGNQAKLRRGAEGLAIAEATDFVTRVATYVIYLIPVFGILLVMASDKAWKFSQTWIGLSFVLYIAALGISHGVMRPTYRRMLELMRELAAGPPPAGATGGPPPQVIELEAKGRRMAMGGGALNVLLVLLIALMIWKPGL